MVQAGKLPCCCGEKALTSIVTCPGEVAMVYVIGGGQIRIRAFALFACAAKEIGTVYAASGVQPNNATGFASVPECQVLLILRNSCGYLWHFLSDALQYVYLPGRAVD